MILLMNYGGALPKPGHHRPPLATGGVLEGYVKQITEPQPIGPELQVVQVDSLLNHQHSLDVPKLSFQDLAAASIPLKLGEPISSAEQNQKLFLPAEILIFRANREISKGRSRLTMRSTLKLLSK